MRTRCAVACEEQRWNDQQLAQPLPAPAWRLWQYRAPAIVLGCSQRRLLADARDDRGVELLLRGSGGGAVLVGPWMLGLSVALPSGHALVDPSAVANYRWLGELLADVLRDAGIDATALPAEDARAAKAPAELAWACFAGLSPWEVVAGGRKIAGLAQVRRRHGVLLVGGLLLDAPDWPLLCATLGRPATDADALARRTTSCCEQLGACTPTRAIAAPLDERLRRRLGTTAAHTPLPAWRASPQRPQAPVPVH